MLSFRDSAKPKASNSIMLTAEAKGMLVASILFPVLAALSVVLRFTSWKIKNVPSQADDWVIVVAAVRPETLLSRAEYQQSAFRSSALDSVSTRLLVSRLVQLGCHSSI